MLKNTTLLYLFTNIIIGIIGINNPKIMFSFVLLLISFSRFSKNANLLVSSFRNGIGQMAFLILLLIIIIWVYANAAFMTITWFLSPQVRKIYANRSFNASFSFSITVCVLEEVLVTLCQKLGFNRISQYIGRYYIDMLFYIIIPLFFNMINGIITLSRF